MIKESKIIPVKHPKEIIHGEDLLSLFWNKLTNYRKSKKTYGFFIKRGERYKGKIGLEFNFFPLLSDNSEICRVNYADFAKEALTEIEKYRLAKDEVYQICEGRNIFEAMNKPGEYLLSSNEKPIFKVLIAYPIERYTTQSVEFQSFECQEFLRYTPENKENLEELANQVRLEVAVDEEGKNKFLFQMYKHLEKSHKERSKKD